MRAVVFFTRFVFFFSFVTLAIDIVNAFKHTPVFVLCVIH